MNIFDEHVYKYDLWYERPFGRSAFELELRCLKKLTGSFRRGLEVGVGTGRFASGLGITYGIDPSFEMLKLARERGIKVVRGEGENLPFKDDSFNLVLVAVSICFVREPIRVLEEISRVLRSEGKLLLGLVVRESPWAKFYMRKARAGHPIYREAKFYSMAEVERMLTVSGFRRERLLSTLLEEPQDKEPVKNTRIEEGFNPSAGFICMEATLKPR